MIIVRAGSSGGSEVLRFRSSGVAGVPVHDGAGVTAHRWLKVAFIPFDLVKATISHSHTNHERERHAGPPERSAPPPTNPTTPCQVPDRCECSSFEQGTRYPLFPRRRGALPDDQGGGQLDPGGLELLAAGQGQ